MDTINQSLQKDYHKMLFPYAYNILGITEDADMTGNKISDNL